MKGCLSTIGIFVGAVVVIVFSYVWISFYNVEIHCRITIDVQDGNQIKSGSSVIGLLYNINPEWADFDHFNNSSQKRGYAPTVDLGGKGLLLLTFGHATRNLAQQADRNKHVSCVFDDIGCLPFAAYQLGGGGDMAQKKAALHALRQQSGPRDVPFAALPQLDFIADERQALVVVQPEDLAVQFGSGVALKRVVLELTNDAVTPEPAVWPQWVRDNPDMIGMLVGAKT
jgi:hypothetical protein